MPDQNETLNGFAQTGLSAAMEVAVAVARAYEGATAPNPPVGCVLLDAMGDIITMAAHQGAGQLHAEALAISQAQAMGRLADIYGLVVTLEPCNHFGRTPPCTEAILATPAKLVLYGLADPNPHVAGGGAARLRAASLEVMRYDQAAFCEAATLHQLSRLIAPFRKRVREGMPWVTVKQAVNRDGSMLPPPGAKTFTSESSLTFAHALRRRADAIVTGSGTILADEPLFTVRRVPDIAGKRRRLVIMDRRGRVPQAYCAAASARGFTVKIADALEEQLLAVAAEGGLEVLVEAGPTLTAHVLATPLWDEHVRITQTSGADKIETIMRENNVFRHH